MKVQEFSEIGQDERVVLMSCIMDRTVTASIAQNWKEDGVFNSKLGNLVGEWCTLHYKKHKKAPRRAIINYFSTWSERSKNKQLVESVNAFLSNLSDEYDRKSYTTEYALELTNKHLQKVQLASLVSSIQDHLETGELKKAVKKISKYVPIQAKRESVVDLFANEEVVQDAFTEIEKDILMKYPGAAGEMFGDAFSKGHLVAFLAPEKAGKTFMLMDVAYRLVQEKKRVLFVGAGDMTEVQMTRRFMSRFVGKPWKPPRDGIYRVPTELRPGDPPQVELEERHQTEYMSVKRAMKGQAKMQAKYGKNLFKMVSYPNGTVTVDTIQSVLEEEKRLHRWIPDAIVIDYADLLTSQFGDNESRDRINETWKIMRGMAYDSLVVTATQANRESYEAGIITKKTIGEDKRKLAHAVYVFGINITDAEKEQGRMRINCVVGRETEMPETKVVHCAGSRAICHPIMFSLFDL